MYNIIKLIFPVDLIRRKERRELTFPFFLNNFSAVCTNLIFSPHVNSATESTIDWICISSGAYLNPNQDPKFNRLFPRLLQIRQFVLNCWKRLLLPRVNTPGEAPLSRAMIGCSWAREGACLGLVGASKLSIFAMCFHGGLHLDAFKWNDVLMKCRCTGGYMLQKRSNLLCPSHIKFSRHFKIIPLCRWLCRATMRWSIMK